MPRQQKKAKRKSSFLPQLGLTLALILIGAGVILRLHATSQPTFSGVPQVKHSQKKKALPVKILIPSISLSVPIEPAEVVSKKWYVSPNQATFLKNTSYPGEKGPIVIYGHNTRKIFGSLVQVKKGSTITIVSEGKKVSSYKIYSIKVVLPYQIDVLEEEKETLILFTCTGFADSKRLVMKASPISAK